MIGRPKTQTQKTVTFTLSPTNGQARCPMPLLRLPCGTTYRWPDITRLQVAARYQQAVILGGPGVSARLLQRPIAAIVIGQLQDTRALTIIASVASNVLGGTDRSVDN